MSRDRPPLIFVRRLGGLHPVNPAAIAAVASIDGQCVASITKANRNQRRRSLYWITAAVVVGALNDAHGTTLTDQDLHDITRRKLGYFDEVQLPSGDVHIKYHSTSDKDMTEPERAEYTDKAFRLWSNWLCVPVQTLLDEARKEAA